MASLSPHRRRCLARGRSALAPAVALAAALASPPLLAQQLLAQLADLSLEQLRDVVVTTVSRFEEPLDRAAASVYVITADDIRRSGATTIPEALRLAPMLNVDRADANQYAISARGFTNVLANKMLVLIDGRTVYTPLFSGVFWEAQDVVLQDVERIEVISGPSTALWGSNAVNGLIHVITRDAAQTQGPSVRASAGDRERNASLRQGFALGDSGHMRVYAKSYDRSDTYRADGSSVADQADGTQVGFRADWARPGQKLTLQGDAYHGTIDPVQTARTFSGANLTANWSALLASGGEASVRAYLERTQRQQPQSFDERLDTLDVVGQYALPPLAGHRLLVGAGYRSAHDQVSTFNAFAFNPGTRNLAWSRVFAQDQMQFGPAVTATLATSVENNPYTGTEVLPSLRLGWQIDGQRFAWASAARAARAPARVDREFFQPAKRPAPLVDAALGAGHHATPGLGHEPAPHRRAAQPRGASLHRARHAPGLCRHADAGAGAGGAQPGRPAPPGVGQPGQPRGVRARGAAATALAPVAQRGVFAGPAPAHALSHSATSRRARWPISKAATPGA